MRIDFKGRWVKVLGGILTLGVVFPAAMVVPARAQSPFDLQRDFQISNEMQKASNEIKRLERTPLTRSNAVHLEARRQLEMAPSFQEINVRDLRREARAERMELSRLLFNVSFEGLWTMLTFEGHSPVEWEVEEAREHARRYCELMKQIEALTGETAEYERTWAARESNLRIQGLGNYAVHNSDSSVNASSHPTQLSDPTTGVRRTTHTESYFQWVKVPKVVGFDKNGNPVKEMRDDVILRTRVVGDK